MVALCGVTLVLTALLRRELIQRRVAEEASIRLNDELRKLAVTDPLTGLQNRRRFDEVLARDLRRATRTRQPLALILLDADAFKAFNDRYGHQLGDTALRMIADTLSEAIGWPSATLCRIGGEEFAAILPDTGPVEAEATARRIRGPSPPAPCHTRRTRTGSSPSASASPAWPRIPPIRRASWRPPTRRSTRPNAPAATPTSSPRLLQWIPRRRRPSLDARWCRSCEASCLYSRFGWNTRKAAAAISPVDGVTRSTDPDGVVLEYPGDTETRRSKIYISFNSYTQDCLIA